ncbi:MAG: TolC family protein [Rikenellaceae bacterium]
MRTTYIVLVVAIMLMCGCGSNRFSSPDVELPESYIFTGNMDTLSEMVNISWWEEFQDPTLNHLILTALVNNKDILVALSSLEQSRLNIGVARASFLPVLDLVPSAGAVYTESDKIIQKYGFGPSLSWEISLFGEMKNSTRAARAAYLSTEQAAKAVMLSVAAQTATTYFTLMGYCASLEIAIRSYQLRKESSDLIDSLVHYGMGSELNLEQALSLTEAAAADIPRYQRAVTQTSLALNVLLGENPTKPYVNQYGPYSWGEDCSYIIPTIPIGLPSSLLERRPDIMEAYYNMAEAWANVGVARAERFPSIALTVGGGLGSMLLKNLISSKSLVWDASAIITQPIFSFGAKKKNFEIYREKFYSSTIDYEQAIITALSEVEQSLVAVSTYKTQLEKYSNLLDANYKTQQMTASLHKNGLLGYLDVIDAEQKWYESQLQYVNILSEQYINYVNLYKSLGGGW